MLIASDGVFTSKFPLGEMFFFHSLHHIFRLDPHSEILSYHIYTEILVLITLSRFVVQSKQAKCSVKSKIFLQLTYCEIDVTTLKHVSSTLSKQGKIPKCTSTNRKHVKSPS